MMRETLDFIGFILGIAGCIGWALVLQGLIGGAA